MLRFYFGVRTRGRFDGRVLHRREWKKRQPQGCLFLVMFASQRGFEPPRAGETPPLPALSGVDKVPASILLPAGFVRFGAERLFLAEADRLDAVGADAARH